MATATGPDKAVLVEDDEENRPHSLPPNTDPEGAALKLTRVGGDRAYEFNINLN